MAHAKDRDAAGRFAAAGAGAVDFVAFLRDLREVGIDGPVIAHDLSGAEAPSAASFLAGCMAA